MAARRNLSRPLLLLAALCFGLGCVTASSGGALRYGWFTAPEPTDPWSPKIGAWQARERALPATESLRGPASVSGAAQPGAARSERQQPDLRAKWFAFRSEHKRALAREAAAWIQEQARQHYIADGPIDHWATLEETLARDGDDCDGLELLVYHFLRDLGFAEHEVYRAIVYRPSDGQHHMVTLWFEDPDDPWVIDPTGAMTTGMPRMSDVPTWAPLKLFSETEEFSVEALGLARHAPR